METKINNAVEKHEFWLKYIMIPIELFANKHIDRTDIVLFYMIDHYDEGEGKCFASNGYLSDITDIRENAVSASLSKLEKEGYIIREIQKEKGNKRILKINPKFKITHNQYSLEINSRMQSRRLRYHGPGGDAITVQEESSPPTGGTNINKYSREEEYIDTVSKETDGPGGPSDKRSISFDNLRPIKLSPYRNFTDDAKELFLYWNSKGKPLTVHGEKGDTFTRALTNLDRLLHRKHSKDEIKRSIDNYFWLVTWKEFLLAGTKKAGTVVGLPDFIKFGVKTKDLISQYNPLLIEKGVTSWFEECLNTRDVLEIRWSKMIKDMYPAETKKLKELWEEFGGRKLDPLDDENIFRRISIKAHTYFEKLNGKYQWGTEERYPIARLHHLFDVGQAEGWDWRKAQPTYLLSQKMFTEKLPAHWERIAMAESLSDEQWREMEDGTDARKRKEFNSHFSRDPNSTRERTLAIIASQAMNIPEATAEELRDY